MVSKGVWIEFVAGLHSKAITLNPTQREVHDELCGHAALPWVLRGPEAVESLATGGFGACVLEGVLPGSHFEAPVVCFRQEWRFGLSVRLQTEGTRRHAGRLQASLQAFIACVSPRVEAAGEVASADLH